MQVVAIPEVHAYLEWLAQLLYEKEYFGFRESAKRYVDELFLDIETRLPWLVHKPAPKYFDRYGKGLYYATFKKSKHTCYYAFFSKYCDRGETFYQVRYIANNHTIAQHI